MMLLWSIILIYIFLESSLCKLIDNSEETSVIDEPYREQVHSAHDAERSERNVTKTAMEDFEIGLLNILADFRVQTLTHKNYTLQGNNNEKVKKWRKSFRYLVNLCSSSFPNDKVNAQTCLERYMKSDNFDNVLQRLLTLLEKNQADFVNEIEVSLGSLQSCVKQIFSVYMNELRTIMERLNECYKKKITFEQNNAMKDAISKTIFDITKLKCQTTCA